MVLRQTVFVVEQRCAYLDADGIDPYCKHLLGWLDPSSKSNAKPQLVAAVRVVPALIKYDEVSIGRVVTANTVRGQAVGQALMAQVLEQLDRDATPTIRISAQNYLRKFYRSFNFEVRGDVYDEDGIEHIEMLRVKTKLETDQFEGLMFEPLTIDHASELFEPLSDAKIYRYMDEQAQPDLLALQKRYSRLQKGAPAKCGQLWLNWLVRDAKMGTPLGTLQATLYEHAAADIGYALAPAHWGRGVATSSIKWLATMLKNRYGMQQILASVDVRNVGSARALEKAGFTCHDTVDTQLHGQSSRDHLYRF